MTGGYLIRTGEAGVLLQIWILGDERGVNVWVQARVWLWVQVRVLVWEQILGFCRGVQVDGGVREEFLGGFVDVHVCVWGQKVLCVDAHYD